MTDCLAEIEARRKAATPGPWAQSEYDGIWYAEFPDKPAAILVDADTAEPNVPSQNEQDRCNVTFIAHSPEDIKWLEEEVKRLRAEVSSLEDTKEDMFMEQRRRDD